MGHRLDLQAELAVYIPQVYYQPPANIQMVYPCIVYNKTGKIHKFGNDRIYMWTQEYQITVIEKNPDSGIADNMEAHFQYCKIEQNFSSDNLNHTTLKLYY